MFLLVSRRRSHRSARRETALHVVRAHHLALALMEVMPAAINSALQPPCQRP